MQIFLFKGYSAVDLARSFEKQICSTRHSIVSQLHNFLVYVRIAILGQKHSDKRIHRLHIIYSLRVSWWRSVWSSIFQVSIQKAPEKLNTGLHKKLLL